MARRKAKKRTSRRRRSVGGIGKLNASNPIVKFGSIAAGYFMGDKVNEQIDKAAGDKMDGKLLAGLQTFGGLVINGTVPLGKRKIVKPGVMGLIMTVGGGVLAGAGIKRGLSEFGIISGFSDVPVLGGYRSVPALNGYNPTPGSHMGSYQVPTPAGKVMGSVPGEIDGSGINASDR